MTDNRTTELLPCPICGRKATVFSWWSSDEECGMANVGCSRESYVSGYECARIHVDRVDEKTALEDAIRIWNTRAATTIGKVQMEIEPVSRGTLTAEQVREAVEGHGNIMDNRLYEDWQAIADELNGKLGSGTCEPNWVLQYETQTQEFWRCECGNCGECFGVESRESFPFKMTVDKVDIPNFCQNCGKAVKR